MLELLFRIKYKHPDCFLIWIPATNTESLHQAYLETAQQLGIPGWKDNKADIKRLVQAHLSKESSGQWLLVFDNADDLDMWIAKAGSRVQRGQGSQPLIDYLPKSRRGVVVFTTLDRKTAVKLAQQNVVGVLAMGEVAATQLLRKCLVNADLVHSLQDTNALLCRLTYLPLAIVQAAVYINENAISLADYLLLMGEQEEEGIDLVSEEFEDDGRYRDIKNPVATTCLISFDQIRRRDELAADYLSFMACVEPKDIPQLLLPPGPSRKKGVDAIGMLTAYSFVSRWSADECLDLHRLVHLATRNWLRKEELLVQVTEKAIAPLEEVFPNHSHENRSVWRSYLPHARFTLECNLVDKDWKARIDLMLKYGRCLHEDGRWNEAEKPIKQVFEAQKTKLGTESPYTLSSMAWLASMYRNKGLWGEAEELEVQVMETRKRELGAEHPDTLISMANLAATYRNKGLWGETEELEVQVMETSKMKLGADHPDTLTSINNLSFTWKAMGRQTKALKSMNECVQLSKPVLELNHPQFLSSSTALSAWQLEGDG
jgi:hypothetical protein